jgi:hypothetical protein
MSYVGPAPEENLTEIQQMTLDMLLPVSRYWSPAAQLIA